MSIIKLTISTIDLTGSPDFREHLREDSILEYMERYKEKLPMKPILVFKQKDRYLLADGRHRIEAMNRLGIKEVEAEGLIGNETQCWVTAIKSNCDHGTRWNNTEKRNIVKKTLAKFPEASHRSIAEMCNVSPGMVDKYSKNSVPTVGTHSPKPLDNKPPIPHNQKEKSLTTSGTQPATPPSETSPAAPAKPTVDTMGYPIPIKIQPTFVRAHEIREQISTLRAVLNLIRDVGIRRDPLWMGLNFQDFEVGIKRLTEMLRAILPEVVCTHCQGHPETAVNNNCPMCHGKGFISHYWFAEKGMVPVEVQALREKQIVAYNKKHLTVQPQVGQVVAVA